MLKCWLRIMDVGRVVEIWLAACIREHLAGPEAAGREQTQWSRQHTGVYGELWLAKSVASF